MSSEDLTKFKIEKEVLHPLKRRSIYYILILVVILIALTLFFFNYSKVVTVSTVKVSITHPSQSLTVLNAAGYVVAQRKAALASKTTGRLIWLGVEEGSYVKKGDVVAKLEDEDVLALKNQAEANVNLAKANLESSMAELRDAETNLSRQKILFEKNFATQAELDTAKLRYEKAKASVKSSDAALSAAVAALKSAEVSLEYTFIRAPFDGVVLTKNADIGDIITPLGAAANAKASVITIADLNSLLVEADISESNLNLVRLRQPCEILLDAIPDKRYKGFLHMIVPTADRTKASIMVKVKFAESDKRILPEMSAKINFLSRKTTADEEKEQIMINKAALLKNQSEPSIFVVKGNRAVLTKIKIGKSYENEIEVLEGLTADDIIVLNPPDNLKNNTKVKLEAK